MRTLVSLSASFRQPAVHLARLLTCLTILAVATTTADAQRSPTGRFRIEGSPRYNGGIELTISDKGEGFNRGMTTLSVAPNELKGLSQAQLDDSYAGPIHFSLTRDAGTITFDGKASGGEGSGQYTFAADPAFSSALSKRGLGTASESEQFQLALFDVGYPLLDELRSQHYPTATIPELVRMGMHGVDVDFVHDMGALHYQFASLSELTKFRDHGVDPEFVSELRKAGYSNLGSEELLKLKDHGVDADFISDLSRAGFSKLEPDMLLRARDHGVTPSFIEGIKRAGYSGFSIADFVRLRDHGVSASFARRMKERSSSTPSVEDLVSAMDHGDDDGE